MVGPTAPPAFLVDQLRSTSARLYGSDYYNNRSWVYITDFPSAERLHREGIDRLIVASRSREPIATDLEHILRAWANDGLVIDHQSLGEPRLRSPLRLPRPSWITGMKLWVRARFGADPVKGHGFMVGPSSG